MDTPHYVMARRSERVGIACSQCHTVSLFRQNELVNTRLGGKMNTPHPPALIRTIKKKTMINLSVISVTSSQSGWDEPQSHPAGTPPEPGRFVFTTSHPKPEIYKSSPGFM